MHNRRRVGCSPGQTISASVPSNRARGSPELKSVFSVTGSLARIESAHSLTSGPMPTEIYRIPGNCVMWLDLKNVEIRSVAEPSEIMITTGLCVVLERKRRSGHFQCYYSFNKLTLKREWSHSLVQKPCWYSPHRAKRSLDHRE